MSMEMYEYMSEDICERTTYVCERPRMNDVLSYWCCYHKRHWLGDKLKSVKVNHFSLIEPSTVCAASTLLSGSILPSPRMQTTCNIPKCGWKDNYSELVSE